jgi:GNAT superfamily N-acetyltransferase
MVDNKDIKIETISNKHKTIITKFITYEPDLKEYLVEDALDHQNKKISKTFLMFYRSSLVGYITLLCDSLRLEGELKDSFKNKNILYKTLPALKIGRLAVDDNYQKKGFGRTLLQLAYVYAKKISDDFCGCRFLILDAKRNKEPSKDSVHFYKKMNFSVLKERQKGTLPMYLDILVNNKSN